MPPNRSTTVTRFTLLLTLLFVIGGIQHAYAEPDAPQALAKPTNVACRPHGGVPDKVRVSWKDTNDENADYRVYRKAINSNDWGNPIATVTDPDWQYVDDNASTTTVYHYRVTAFSGNEETSAGADETCREPLVLDSNSGNYRMYYRLVECPSYDGKSACTENVDVNGKNKHANDALQTSEAYRTQMMDLGFNDPAFFNGQKPFPLDFFPCNNGCANGDGIQYRPDWFASGEYNPDTGAGDDYEYFVVGHEIFHKVQGTHGGSSPDPYGKWIIEGQARATEDKFCIFTNSQCNVWDTVAEKFYLGQINGYLGAPEKSLLEASYNAALFWIYVMEQFAGIQTEPGYGVDVMVKYWQQNQSNKDSNAAKDGIGTLNDTLEQKIGTDRRFKDIFQDFAVANYAKDLLTNPVPAAFAKYNYRDEENCPTCTYDPVKRTISSPLNAAQSLFGTVSVDAWGTRYFEVTPDAAVSLINVEVDALAGTPHPFYYHLLAIDNNQIVDQWSGEGQNMEQSIDNTSPAYDRLVLIVAAFDNPVNFHYGFNLTDGIYILSPNAQFPAQVGEATAPKKFIAQVQVIDKDLQPVAGIDTSAFSITVGSTLINPPANPADDPIIASTYIAGQYWLVLRAPANPGCTECDLKIEYAGYSDTEATAVRYGPQPDVDNMIVIDRSGSMAGAKIDAAKGAAKLYVDAYSDGDRVGVVSYSDAANGEYGLTGWTNATRIQAQDAIDNIDPPVGATATGAGLREGLAQLVGQNTPNPAWAMVLLSDGKDTVDDTKNHIPEFLKEYKARKKAGDQVPVIHVVAVGDDADGVALESVAAAAGGQFQFLPEASLIAASAEMAAAATFPLELAEVYRVFAESVRDEQQIFASRFELGPANPGPVVSKIQVDKAASEAIFVLKMEPANAANQAFFRLTAPGNATGIAPTLDAQGHHVWRIAAPVAGEWLLTVRGCTNCATSFLVEAALVSDLTLEVFLGLPVEERLAGKPMPILALLSDVAPITGATVKATVERTGETLTLFDDGQHGDGGANDGFYGGVILNTFNPGGYTVIVDADGVSQLAGAFKRRARVGFYMLGGEDSDKDRLPDWWEGDCTDPAKNDEQADPDGDGLVNAQEFFRHTDPCDPDTDNGGESDGSEVARGNNPLFPKDDFTSPPRIKAWPQVGQVHLRLSAPANSPKLTLYRALTPQGPFTLLVSDLTTTTYVDTTVVNNTRYCYRAIAQGRATSAPSNVSCATPKLDPFAPHGEIVLPPGVKQPVARTTLVLLEGYDDPNTEEHPIFDGALLMPADESGLTEMLLSNRGDFEGATWEPYQPTKAWTFAPRADGMATVFVRYKDHAGNESDVAALTVQVDPNLTTTTRLFLPLVQR